MNKAKDARAFLGQEGKAALQAVFTNPANFLTLNAMPKPQAAINDEERPFPVRVLPEALRSLCGECVRVLSVPWAMPAACGLAVVSAALGSRLRVRSVLGKITPANIFTLIAASTGTGKSETHREFVAPFEACNFKAQARWQEQVLPNARAEARIVEKQIKDLESKIKAGADTSALHTQLAALELKLENARARMKQPHFIGSDFTTAKLIELLCNNDGQFFASSPDAKNFVDMVTGRYNDGSTDEEVYLKGFSLESIDRHRVGDGSMSASEACIAGLWLTQPDKLERLLAQRCLSDGGLLPRLLLMNLCCPPLRVNPHEQGVSTASREGFATLVTELFQSFRQSSQTIVIEATDEARELLVQFHNNIADRREGDLHDVTGFAARWGEYAWRLALVVHAIEHRSNASKHPLSLTSAQAGKALAEYFAHQQLDVLHAGRNQARAELVQKVLQLAQVQGQLIASDLYRNGITPRGQPEIAVKLLANIAATGKLTSEAQPTQRKNHTQLVYRLPRVAPPGI